MRNRRENRREERATTVLKSQDPYKVQSFMQQTELLAQNEEPTQPPEEIQPTDSPGEPGEPPQLPEVCSSTGFAGGFFLLGSVLMFRNHRNFRRKPDLN